MDPLPKASSRHERAAALIIVLALIVLMTGLTVAYLSRTTNERTIAHSSFNQSKADELAASTADLIIGDLRNEIANGSSPTPTPNVLNAIPTPTPFVFRATTAAYVVPMRNPTPTPGTTPAIPNLIRRSVRSDEAGGVNAMPSPSPGVPSHASAVSSTTDVSANGRFVSLPRWNKHYLIPRTAGAAVTDTTPISAFNALAPDWVLLTRNGPVAFSGWNSSLADTTVSNSSYCVGRYAFAIYDEGGLLDVNVAGYPSSATAAQYGPKGVAAFADLTVLGLSGTGNGNDIDQIVGWRNYFSTAPTGNFPSFKSLKAANYVNSVLSNTNGFMAVTVPSPTPNNMSNTDQQFTMRQSLIKLVVGSLSSSAVNALQYLGTFSREFNAPSWTPALNATDMGGNNGAGNIYAYKDNAANPAATPINPNLLNVRVVNLFTRADGTQTVIRSPCDTYHQQLNDCGEPLIKTRFPLTRLAGVTPTGTPAGLTMLNGVLVPATATTIQNYKAGTTVQRDFGLVWNTASNRWDYVGATGSTVQTSIEPLVSANPPNVVNDNREPNFFELLKAAILSGSVGMGTGSGTGNPPTFVAAEGKYYNTTDTTHGTSSDYQIMQIGANIINQWDSGNIPIFIAFGSDPSTSQPYEIAGIKNLPYLSKLVFKPAWSSQKIHGVSNYQFDAWLLPSLWNPHQNATSATGSVRMAMTAGTMTATLTYSGGSLNSTNSIQGNSGPSETQYMTVNASTYASTLTSPSAPTAATAAGGSSIDNKEPEKGYYGFHFTFPGPSTTVTPTNSLTAYPAFGTGCDFQMQVQVGTVWKPYQTWKGCAQPATRLVCQSPPSSNGGWSATNLQDPEFVSIDPRTLVFGVWGNDGNHSGTTADYTTGTQSSLDSTLNPPSVPVELITALPPNGSLFTFPSTPPYSLYLFSNNSGSTVEYTDLDLVQRLGDFPTAGDAIDPGNDELQPSLSSIRPLALNGAFQNGIFQSVAELGHVFRGQPWKTLTFTAAMPTTSATKARSADAGLLDVFTLHESSVEAGKTSLNTSEEPVLRAILSKAALNLGATSTITANQVDDGSGHGIVPALMSLTATQPMVNKAELVTRLAADSSVTGLGNKEAREAVMRAFSDVGQTRTWNLLIDLIAQSGRYPPNASTLTGFLVEGEQHYWVHVAIDRFTGQVIDKQIEVVNE